MTRTTRASPIPSQSAHESEYPANTCPVTTATTTGTGANPTSHRSERNRTDRLSGQNRPVRKMGKEMLQTAWKGTIHSVQSQFTPSQRPYEPSTPASGHPGLNNEWAAIPSVTIPNARPRMNTVAGPPLIRSANSRIARALRP